MQETMHVAVNGVYVTDVVVRLGNQRCQITVDQRDGDEIYSCTFVCSLRCLAGRHSTFNIRH